jgi:DNA polymerase-3 subunit alpha
MARCASTMPRQPPRPTARSRWRMTDLNNLFGAVKFYKACRGAGVKPVIGVDVWMEPVPDSGDKAPSRLLLLVQDMQGYLNLSELLARAWTQQRAARAGLGALGVAAGTGRRPDRACRGPTSAPSAWRCWPATARARALAARLSAIFPQRFYLELQRGGLPTTRRMCVPRCRWPPTARPAGGGHAPGAVPRSRRLRGPRSAGLRRRGRDAGQPQARAPLHAEQRFKTQAQMAELFADVPSALANTVEIARRCNLSWCWASRSCRTSRRRRSTGSACRWTTTSARNRARAWKALLALFPDAARREQERPRYVERLEFEIETIIKMGFPGYFMIVSDFIVWAKDNGCPVGPGRGSGAGSLVAYALFITDLDPLQLQAAVRALPEPRARVDARLRHRLLPGQPRPRHRLREGQVRPRRREPDRHLRHHGGQGRAARRGPRAGHGLRPCRQHRQADPGAAGQDGDAGPCPTSPTAASSTRARKRPSSSSAKPPTKRWPNCCAWPRGVEGIVRNVGMHAGGVLIAPGKITDFCPLYQQPGSDSAVSQYDKDDVEAIGLVKFDFLGLATLTILELAKDFIRARRTNRATSPTRPAAGRCAGLQAVLRRPDRSGVPVRIARHAGHAARGQADAAGRPDRAERDVPPGADGEHPELLRAQERREEVEYPHPLLGQVLAETYGIFVYQEQVMQAAQVMGGYSLGGADLLRRAMGKKKPEEMAKERVKFRDGAMAKGIDEKKADEVFDLMEKFAGYGFNKSHAAAYSLLAYHTAWIKVHCTAEFYAANMTIEQDNTDKLKVLLADAKLFGVRFEPPDVNRGVYRFEPVDDKTWCATAWAPSRARAGRHRGHRRRARRRDGQGGGPFRSLFDFCARVDKQRVNKRAVEALIKAGAFDAAAPRPRHCWPAWAWPSTGPRRRPPTPRRAGCSTSATPTAPARRSRRWWRWSPGASASGCSTRRRRSASTSRATCSTPTPTRCGASASAASPSWWTAASRRCWPASSPTLRVVNGRSGKVLIFKLDDGSEAIEAVANDELTRRAARAAEGRRARRRAGQAAARPLCRRPAPERAAGVGPAAARARFGRCLRSTSTAAHAAGGRPWSAVAGAARGHRARRAHAGSAPVRLRLQRPQVTAEIDLGDDGRIWPSDEALARWRAAAQGRPGGGSVRIVQDRAEAHCGYSAPHVRDSADRAGAERRRRARGLPGGRAAGHRPAAARDAGAARARLRSPFGVIVGTSAGAINAAALACHADRFDLSVEVLRGSGRTSPPNRSTAPIHWA